MTAIRKPMFSQGCLVRALMTSFLYKVVGAEIRIYAAFIIEDGEFIKEFIIQERGLRHLAQKWNGATISNLPIHQLIGHLEMTNNLGVQHFTPCSEGRVTPLSEFMVELEKQDKLWV